MPVEFIGMIATQQQSEIHPRSGPVVDRAFVRSFGRAHEDGGFDKALIGYSGARPDGLQVATYAAAHTERLHFLVAHRPGFVFPTLAARSFATLDQFTEGRVALHTITDGKMLSSVATATTSRGRAVRAHRRVPENPQASLDLDGPVQFRRTEAYAVGSKHADIYAVWREPLAETAGQIAAVRAEVAKYRRTNRRHDDPLPS
jgi:alkanesulfonate monooxygenase